jgi:dihydroorotate dehydrogenase
LEIFIIEYSYMAKIIGSIYRQVLKPIAFLFDAEKVHDAFTGIGIFLGKYKTMRALTRWLFAYKNSRLEQTVLGIKFANPIGLSAGFDKDARLTDTMPEVGFGFEEVGSVTGEPCEGNPKPRLWRLPKLGSLVVHYGLKNEGCDKIFLRLAAKKFKIPVGTNVAKTNNIACADTETGIADYAKAFASLKDIGDYFTVNISCPNAYGGEPFTDPARLDRLLARLDAIPTKKPVFLKLSPDLTTERLDALIDVCSRHRVHGFICTNLTKEKKEENEIRLKGGLSGRMVKKLSDDQIAYIYKKTLGKYIIIGCGGVFSAKEAFHKIQLGASLVELITGMIFEGPQLIGEINRGLVRLMDQHGFKTISDAIGTADKNI